MSVAASIEQKLQSALGPEVLQLENESHLHSGPAQESHFKLTVVSGEFGSLSRVKRHQRVYGILAEELDGPVHALALHLYSPDEWAQQGTAVPDSPNCRGGSKAS